MEFLFQCSTRHLTRSLRSFISNRVEYLNRNSSCTQNSTTRSDDLSGFEPTEAVVKQLAHWIPAREVWAQELAGPLCSFLCAWWEGGGGTETVISSNGSSTDITTILNKHYRSEKKKKKGKSNLAGRYILIHQICFTKKIQQPSGIFLNTFTSSCSQEA